MTADLATRVAELQDAFLAAWARGDSAEAARLQAEEEAVQVTLETSCARDYQAAQRQYRRKLKSQVSRLAGRRGRPARRRAVRARRTVRRSRPSGTTAGGDGGEPPGWS